MISKFLKAIHSFGQVGYLLSRMLNDFMECKNRLKLNGHRGALSDRGCVNRITMTQLRIRVTRMVQ